MIGPLHAHPAVRRVAIAALSTFAVVAATGCRGKVLGTVPFSAPGAATARVTLGAKPAVLWADLDGKWKGPKSSQMDVTYDVDVFRAGASVGKVSCSTANRNATVCGVHKNIMGEHDADCEVGLACAFPKLPPGEVELRVVARTGPNVLLARKLSLNVRED